MIKPVAGQTLVPVKAVQDTADVKGGNSIAGEDFKIIFKKNIAAKQTAWQLKFHPIEEPAVAGKNLGRTLAGEIVGRSQAAARSCRPSQNLSHWGSC